jgi:hypothetical protein
MAAGQNHYDAFLDTTAEALIATDPAVLYEVAGQNTGSADMWLQIFDRDTAPTAGATPVYSYLVLQGQTYAVKPPSPPGDNGRRMFVGIAVAWSHAQASYTASEVPGEGGTIFVGWREASNPTVP